MLDETPRSELRCKDYLGDTVIEFEITPNLVHAFSILGIAREAHALTGEPITTPSGSDLGLAPKGAPDLVTIEARISARGTGRWSSTASRSDHRRSGCRAG